MGFICILRNGRVKAQNYVRKLFQLELDGVHMSGGFVLKQVEGDSSLAVFVGFCKCSTIQFHQIFYFILFYYVWRSFGGQTVLIHDLFLLFWERWNTNSDTVLC